MGKDVGCSDLGAHIDGFIALAAHSLVLQSGEAAPVTGRQADVLQAANTALEAALRLIRPGKLVSEVGICSPDRQLSSAVVGRIGRILCGKESSRHVSRACR